MNPFKSRKKRFPLSEPWSFLARYIRNIGTVRWLQQSNILHFSRRVHGAGKLRTCGRAGFQVLEGLQVQNGLCGTPLCPRLYQSSYWRDKLLAFLIPGHFIQTLGALPYYIINFCPSFGHFNMLETMLFCNCFIKSADENQLDLYYWLQMNFT